MEGYKNLITPKPGVASNKINSKAFKSITFLYLCLHYWYDTIGFSLLIDSEFVFDGTMEINGAAKIRRIFRMKKTANLF
jgi:hypothetical protein